MPPCATWSRAAPPDACLPIGPPSWCARSARSAWAEIERKRLAGELLADLRRNARGQPQAQPRPAHGGGPPDPPRHPGPGLLPAQIAEGKSKKEALRALKRRISDAVWRQLQVDLRRR
jgi:hypothetical protein